MKKTLPFLIAAMAVLLIYYLIFPFSFSLDLRSQRDFKRIVSLAPSYTEVIKALNFSDRLVGVTSQCTVKDKTIIGSFQEANFEAIIDLKPDLILAVPHLMAQGVLKLLLDQGIHVFAEQPDSLSDIKRINRELAHLLGVKHRGLEINREIDTAIHEAKLWINSRIQGQEKKQALIAFSHSPLVVAGNKSYPSEIIEALGLINVAKGESPWPIWSMEAMLKIKPKILILAEGQSELAGYQRLFSNLGIDPKDIKITLLAPTKPLFISPSPLLIDDTHRLLVMLDEALKIE